MQAEENKRVKSKSKKDDGLHNGYYQTMMDKKDAVEGAFSLYLDAVRQWVRVDEKAKQQVTCSAPAETKTWLTGKEWAEQLGIKTNLLNSRLCVLRSHLPKEMILFCDWRKKIPLYKAKELGEWIEKNYPGLLKPTKQRKV